MTESLSTQDTTQVEMSSQQFSQLITTVAAALRQTSAPLTPDQQTVALQFRLLRNGLGRFSSASEAFDRALLRVDQVHEGGRSELVFHDPIPGDARTMVLVVDSRRVPQQLPSLREYGLHGHGLGDELVRVVERVELLDQLGAPIAAGVPVQVTVQTSSGDPFLDAVRAFLAQDPTQQSPRYSAKVRPSTRSTES